MSAYLSTELGKTANQTAAPVGYKPTATVYGAKLHSIRASFTLNTQTTSDTLVMGILPEGATFCGGEIVSDTSLSTATLAIGYAGATGAYRAAATFTATDTLTPFGITAAVKGDPLTVDTQIIGTIATASLPASGNLVVFLFYTTP